MNKRTFALIAVFLVQLLYGLNFTFAKLVMNEGYIKPFGFVLLRVIGAAILFWILDCFMPKEKIDRKDFKTFFLAAVFGVATNMLLFLGGLELTTPIHASVIMITTPIIILVFSALFLKERITGLKIIGILLGFAGAIVLSVYGKSTRTGDHILLGNLMVFANAISYSIYIIIIKKLTQKYHPFTFIKWLFLFGIFMVLPFGYQDVLEIKLETFTPYVYFSIGFVIIGATFFTYTLNPLALRNLKASTVGTFIYLQPVIAGTFAIAMGVDTINIVKVVAMLLIFSGVYLVSKTPKLKG
ncbi:DMT family transporter [Oceanihabitans sp. 2_MG-2023]|uniref:DMT family transporter n=1 Tax=Oceanihabitans sp. 2_MG-2023 TaxID=3062661 RepID=UPI0026E15FAC|nr:DMT family transporter [Oceanihabitans sp. 2_MG-2023]MDO6595694.1 DMT family transporter [Oceanihabitans sp. 2_MG-2023]